MDSKILLKTLSIRNSSHLEKISKLYFSKEIYLTIDSASKDLLFYGRFLQDKPLNTPTLLRSCSSTSNLFSKMNHNFKQKYNSVMNNVINSRNLAEDKSSTLQNSQSFANNGIYFGKNKIIILKPQDKTNDYDEMRKKDNLAKVKSEIIEMLGKGGEQKKNFCKTKKLGRSNSYANMVNPKNIKNSIDSLNALLEKPYNNDSIGSGPKYSFRKNESGYGYLSKQLGIRLRKKRKEDEFYSENNIRNPNNNIDKIKLKMALSSL